MEYLHLLHAPRKLVRVNQALGMTDYIQDEISTKNHFTINTNSQYITRREYHNQSFVRRGYVRVPSITNIYRVRILGVSTAESMQCSMK